jgi:hypothetical protein
MAHLSQRFCRKFCVWTRSAFSLELLCCQRIELVGGRARLLPIVDQLPFLDHVHQLDPRQSALCSPKRFEPQHGPGDPFDGAMVLFDDIIEIFHLADDDRGPVLRIIASDGSRIGLAAIDGDLLGHPMTTDGLGQEARGGPLVPLFRQQKVNRLTGFIHGPIEIAPLAFHLNVGILLAKA